jgi:hypothetical protein
MRVLRLDARGKPVRVDPPERMARRAPSAAFSPGWQYVIPAVRPVREDATGC